MTAVPESPAALTSFDLDRAWGVHPSVAVRPEPFGALLYHFGTRRLSFLKDPTLLSAVTTLADHPSARAALAASGADAIVTSNPGCMIQMTTSLRDAGHEIPVLHLIEVLDASLRGVLPDAVRRPARDGA